MSTRFFFRIVVAWLLFALLELAFSVLTTRGEVTIGSELVYVLGEAAFWIAVTPLAWRALKELDARPLRQFTFAAICIGLYLIVAVANAEWRRLLLLALGEKLTVPLFVTFMYFGDFNLLACGAILLSKRMTDADTLLVSRTNRVLGLRGQFAHVRLSALEAQLHPHFMFNTLGAVAELVHESPAAAKRMLWYLAELLRSVTDGSSTGVLFSNELRSVAAYVEIQKLRFADWLTIESEIDPRALDVMIPRLILQPMIENALRHGLTGRTERGVISIEASVVEKRLRMTVSDNGVGLRPDVPTSGHGIGLSNLRERLTAEYGTDFTVALTAAKAGGTTALIEVPADHEWSEQPDTDTAVETGATHSGVFRLLHRYPVIVAITGWLVWGALWLQQSMAFRFIRHRLTHEQVWPMVGDHVVAVLLWFLLTPVAVFASRRWPIVPPRIRTALPHAIAASCFAIAHTFAWDVLSRTEQAILSQNAFSTILIDVLLYSAVVLIVQIRASHERRFAQETAAERLTARIHEERLAATTSAFRPASTLAELERLAHDPREQGRSLERGVLRLADEMRSMLERARGAHNSLLATVAD